MELWGSGEIKTLIYYWWNAKLCMQVVWKKSASSSNEEFPQNAAIQFLVDTQKEKERKKIYFCTKASTLVLVKFYS